MLMTRLKATAAGLLVAALGLGMGLWAQRPAAADTRGRRTADDNGPAATAQAGKAGGRDYEPPPRPLGEWEHVLGPHRVTLHVEANRISGTCSISESGQRVTFNGRGDYGVTKDSILYGVLTDVDCPDDEDEAAEATEFLDQPFSFRFRVDGDVLIVKDVKFAGLDLDGKEKDEMLMFLQGRYKRKSAPR